LLWLKIGTGDRLLWRRKWTFGFYKMWGISWVDEERLASQKGLCSKELVILLINNVNKNFLLQYEYPRRVLPHPETACRYLWLRCEPMLSCLLFSSQARNFLNTWANVCSTRNTLFHWVSSWRAPCYLGGRDSSVDIATFIGWTVFSSKVSGSDFFLTLQTDSQAHPAYLTMATGSLCRWQACRGPTSITHLYLALRYVWVELHLLCHICIFMACYRVMFTITCYPSWCQAPSGAYDHFVVLGQSELHL
jgi:hypothetical protein